MKFNPTSSNVNNGDGFYGTVDAVDISIIPRTKKISLCTFPWFVILVSRRSMSIMSDHALIFLARTVTDKSTDARFQATSIKKLCNCSASPVNTWMVKELMIPNVDTIKKSCWDGYFCLIKYEVRTMDIF